MTGDDILTAVVLGIVQGIAEFLPISSSGHIVIVNELLQRSNGRTVDPADTLQLNIAVHLGTLFSILVVYRKDLVPLLKDVRLGSLIVLATLPVVVVALVLRDPLQQIQTPLVAGIGLFLTAGFLLLADFRRGGEDTLAQMTPLRAGVIGCFQAIAIVPGVSRSGSTISGGLLTNLKPEEAARFSFFIAIPAILGAVVFSAKSMLEGEGGNNPPLMLVVGAVVAFLVGWACLSALLALVRRRRLRWFAWYCLAVGTAVIVWQVAERV